MSVSICAGCAAGVWCGPEHMKFLRRCRSIPELHMQHSLISIIIFELCVAHTVPPGFRITVILFGKVRSVGSFLVGVQLLPN